MDEVDLFQRSIKPSWLRIWSFFSAAPLVTSHWNRSTIHQPVPWCSKMLVMSQPDKFVNLVTAPGPFVSLRLRTVIITADNCQNLHIYLSVFQRFGLLVQIWRSLSLSHPQLQFCGRTWCQDSLRFCFATLLPRVEPISEMLGGAEVYSTCNKMTIGSACLATPVTPASLHNTAKLLLFFEMNCLTRETQDRTLSRLQMLDLFQAGTD